MKELETRIININPDLIRKKMQEIKAEKVKSENQINKIFDFPNKKLFSNKGYARIRIIEDLLQNRSLYYMTTKKLLSQEKYKIMEEHEILIDSADEGEKIFQSLGLEMYESISKYRESYQYKNTLIEIDINDINFYPYPYIEIESKDEEEAQEVIELLGYSMDDTTSKTIYELKAEL
ncbi:CYTH domain-containing protein [Clostridium sediminicola]|uniref:class IV adenylate cyclase n=1 Tax=Clostridium sediminicola TaxID=3114879 RepID=UPI0031F24B25